MMVKFGILTIINYKSKHNMKSYHLGAFQNLQPDDTDSSIIKNLQFTKLVMLCLPTNLTKDYLPTNKTIDVSIEDQLIF